MPFQNFTLGVEEEYQIIDPETRQLRGRAKQLISAARQADSPIELQLEMHACQVEIATDICQTLADVRRELTRSRRAVMTAAAQAGCAIAAAGTHPFSDWQDQQITPKRRYRRLEQDLKQTIREMIIFGCHVHVGLSDRPAAIEVINRARIWLPVLLALSANSPFWLGTDTGYDSYRTELWSRLPTAGPPPLFANYEEHQALLQAFRQTRLVVDPTKIYWDIRLSERFPTIEFRATDVCLTLDEAVMIAGLVRGIVATCYQQMQQSVPYLTVHSELLRTAQWSAARYGLTADLVDLKQTGSVPAKDLVEQLLDFVRPALEANGDWDEVAGLVRRTLQQGNGAQRQRQTLQQGGGYEAVVDMLVEQTAQGI